MNIENKHRAEMFEGKKDREVRESGRDRIDEDERGRFELVLVLLSLSFL